MAKMVPCPLPWSAPGTLYSLTAYLWRLTRCSDVGHAVPQGYRSTGGLNGWPGLPTSVLGWQPRISEWLPCPSRRFGLSPRLVDLCLHVSTRSAGFLQISKESQRSFMLADTLRKINLAALRSGDLLRISPPAGVFMDNLGSRITGNHRPIRANVMIHCRWV